VADARDIDPAELSRYPELDPTGHVDLTELDWSLTLTPAQRIRPLQECLNFVAVARRTRVKRYGYDPAAGPDLEPAE